MQVALKGDAKVNIRSTVNPRRAGRYYRAARTAHLERLVDMVPGDFMYRKAMYDFDAEMATMLSEVERVTFGTVVARLCRHTYSTLEVVEPFALSALPENVAIATAARLIRLFGGNPTRTVCYAIENADIAAMLASDLKLPVRLSRALIRVAGRYMVRSHARIVFGTAAAKKNYEDVLGRGWIESVKSLETRLIWGLPRGVSGLSRSRLDGPIVFLGALDERKGIGVVLEAWPAVREQLGRARLVVLGKGRLAALVRSRSALDSSIEFIEDPSREQIRRVLSGGSALVLMSQRSARWREQIGLPILEGLSFGLEIVTSSETGIAGWLVSNGHTVLRPSCTIDDLAMALVGAARSSRTRGEVTASLPEMDGRIVADYWLHGE